MTAQARAGKEGREWTAQVNGAALRVEEVGTGPRTVVFSPALFTNRALFDAPVAALGVDHRCIRYDHRGQGDSGLGAPQPTVESLGCEGLYADALALLDQLGVEACHWVGASIGGFVGVRLAARHPDRILSLVLIGFSSRRVPASNLRQIGMLGGLIRATRPLGPIGAAVHRRATETVMRNMFGETFMSDPTRAADRDLWRRRFGETVAPEAVPMLKQVFGHPGNPPEMLAQVQAPTLLISGADELAHVSDIDNDPLQAARVMPDARLVTIQGAGHMVLVEQPAAGTAAITSFLRSVDG
ncbi:alpha/beta hydrolase [Actinotalea sp. M2MS4P-6]|uniref:alpha/beta fold hydrolase n=1 Tax=Actinotalea sp. M2MS4P-6 TaxID=2983762 RepID=UPI0021E4ED1F|nr:alpha/beta hydrolase [Actinotalea sp. M2MS4P-6]MCV2393670.1 alpha/beta hydrolase [Actinotalea sp. M2MS4P-6]